MSNVHTPMPSEAPFDEVEPWHEPVVLSELLDEIAQRIQQHIVGPMVNSYAATLWIAMTYLVDLFDVTALLIITAPEMRCGKSECKRLIGKMVRRPISADNMSAPVLFRCLDLWHPTLLVDEYDTFIKKDEELRGVFNAGHQRGGCVWRCVGDNFTPKAFDVSGAKVLAGIGDLPLTLIDRGILLPLRRKLPSETIIPQRDVPKETFRNIQSKLARMSVDYAGSISAARPPLPAALNDRARDNWEPLFQIAQVAGEAWLEKAHSASLALSGREEGTKTLGVELLSDIQEAFATKNADRLSSAELIEVLCTDDEKRWKTYNRGFPITPSQVAKRLRDYDICSNTIRVRSTTAKGYLLKQFSDAFARYVFADGDGGTSAVTPSLGREPKALPVTLGLPVTPLAVTHNDGVTLSTNMGADCDGVTAATESETSYPITRNQEIVLSEFKALVVQERMNCFINDQTWPDGLPFDYVIDQIQNKLVRVERRLRRTMTEVILKQLVQRGNLIQLEHLVALPDF